MRLLLARRADPNAVDHGGATALENAVLGGHLALLELLHAAGARIDGSSAFRMAVAGRQGDVVDWLQGYPHSLRHALARTIGFGIRENGA